MSWLASVLAWARRLGGGVCTNSGRLDHVADGESLDGLVLGRASRAVAAADGLGVASALLVAAVVLSLCVSVVSMRGQGGRLRRCEVSRRVEASLQCGQSKTRSVQGTQRTFLGMVSGMIFSVVVQEKVGSQGLGSCRFLQTHRSQVGAMVLTNFT